MAAAFLWADVVWSKAHLSHAHALHEQASHAPSAGLARALARVVALLRGHFVVILVVDVVRAIFGIRSIASARLQSRKRKSAKCSKVVPGFKSPQPSVDE